MIVALSPLPHWLPLLIFIPLVASLLLFSIKSERYSSLISLITAIVLFFLSYELTLSLSGESDAVTNRYNMGGWTAPLGITLSVTNLSQLMILLTSVISGLISWYSIGYFRSSPLAYRFWPLWWVLIAGLNTLFLSNDLFNIYVALEIIGLSGVALVALKGERSHLIAALRYLTISLIGSLCYLLGIALLYRHYGTLDIYQLGELTTNSALANSALISISVGLLLKTAIFPLHFWLPQAHASSTAPVSAVLSSLVVKASLYLLIIIWIQVFPSVPTKESYLFLGALGVISILWGSYKAIIEVRLKVLVAYSTIAQIGYLFLLFPLAIGAMQKGESIDATVEAIAYFIVAHALAKSALFLSAGAIQQTQGHDELYKLQGIALTYPYILLAFALAGVSLIGLPPSSGFMAKWLLLNNALLTENWFLVVIIVSGGLLAAIYIFKVLQVAFVSFSEPSIADIKDVPIPFSMQASTLTMGILAIALGFNAFWLLDLINKGSGS